MTTPFLKMNGLGNDFVVFDGRRAPIFMDEERARRIADRRRGVGCDHVIVLERPQAAGYVRIRIFNADGGEVSACGNASRGVALLAFEEHPAQSDVAIETPAGLIVAHRHADGLIAIDMGPPRFDWREIPLAHIADTRALPITSAAGVKLPQPAAASMGNPHMIFFVPDAEAVPLERVGPALERHPLFPERANVSFAQVLSPERIRLRVWERGAGVTGACGTAACATLAAAVRKNLTARKAELILDGGSLQIEWAGEGVVMTGPAEVNFAGELPDFVLEPA